MSLLRGIAKAGLAYVVIALALLLTFAIEIGLLIAGLLTGRFANPSADSAWWMPILVAILCGGVLVQRRLPQRMQDALCLHQLAHDGTAANAEQRFVRCLLLAAYVLAVLTLATALPLAITLFLGLLPGVQLMLARGEFSLIDYALLSRTCRPEGPPAECGRNRDAVVLLSFAVAAGLAAAGDAFARSQEGPTSLPALYRSNPALFSAMLNWPDNNGATAPHAADAPADLRARVMGATAGSGIWIVQINLVGPATIEGRANDPADVDQIIDLRLALPAFHADAIRTAFKAGADRICKAEQGAAAAPSRLAVRMRIHGELDIFKFNLEQPFLCMPGAPAKGMMGSLDIGLAFDMVPDEQ